MREVRKAMVLAIDRYAFTEIIGQGTNRLGGTMLPPPEGRWGMPPDFLATVAGYGADHEKARAEGRKIMGELGYSADKPLKIKVSTRNIPTYRDQAVILIDHLKQVYIQGELEPLDTAVWYNRMARKDYTVGLNVQGVGIDDPDVVFYETFSCGSERNYTNYCSPEIEKLFEQQSRMPDNEARHEARVGDRQEATGRRRPSRDPARLGRHLLAARGQGTEPRGQHDLQSLAVRGRLDRPLACPASHNCDEVGVVIASAARDLSCRRTSLASLWQQRG